MRFGVELPPRMARQALGKGLGALIKKTEPRNTEGTTLPQIDEGRVIMAKVDEIQASPFQPRRHFNEEHITELADSIRERGLVQPLIVRKVNNTFELIAGERRLRAVRSLGMTEVKVVIHEATDLARDVEEHLSGNKSATLVSLAIEEMLVNIINTNESVDAIDVIVRNNDENILISIKDTGIDFNPVVENDDLKFDNISVLNKIADKIDYSRVLGLNSTVITIKN